MLSRVYAVEQVFHHAVGNFFGALVVNMEEVGNALPELPQSLLNPLQRTYGFRFLEHTAFVPGNLALLFAQTFRAASARICGKYLVGYIVVGI